jgi:hypothetical protein
MRAVHGRHDMTTTTTATGTVVDDVHAMCPTNGDREDERRSWRLEGDEPNGLGLVIVRSILLLINTSSGHTQIIAND